INFDPGGALDLKFLPRIVDCGNVEGTSMDTLIKDVLHAGNGQTPATETQAAVTRTAKELAGAAIAAAQTKLSNGSTAANAGAERQGQSYTDVAATPENRRQIESAVKALEYVHPELTSADSRYQIRMHQETGKLQVALVNTQTGETLEEIPGTKLLEFAEAMSELGGLLFEKRA
ncbi:MAG: flagellar protein FlaG, partial [Leptospirales bacterium]